MRKCPNCSKNCDIGTGVYFDEKNNVRCMSCKKVIMPVTLADEHSITKLPPVVATTSSNPTGYPSHMYPPYANHGVDPYGKKHREYGYCGEG